MTDTPAPIVDPGRLIDMWERWDRSSGDPASAGARMDAISAFADSIGTTWPTVSRSVSKGRRRGLSVRAAIAESIQELTA